MYLLFGFLKLYIIPQVLPLFLWMSLVGSAELSLNQILGCAQNGKNEGWH